MHMRAAARVTVQNAEVLPFDEQSGSALVEVRLFETFAGDMEGESPVRALQVRYDDGTGALISLQRFVGRLGERKGSFVLQGNGTVENGRIKAEWFVVQGSGNSGLGGLRGKGDLKVSLGKARSQLPTTGLSDGSCPVKR